METNPIMIFLIFTAISAFGYKVYLQDKLDGESSSFAFFGIFRRIFGIKYLFPIEKDIYPATQYHLVKTANIALIIFWSCFVLVSILGAVAAFIKSA